MPADDRQSAAPPVDALAAESAEQLEYGIVRVMRNRTSIMVTIPKIWARTLHWEAGDHIRQELHEGNMLLINLDAPARVAKLQRSQGSDHAAPITD